MKRAVCLSLALVLLAGCHHRRAERPIVTTDTVRTDTAPALSEETAPPSEMDVPTQALTDAPPCLPVDPNAKISPKPRRVVTRTPPPAAPEPAPVAAVPPAEASIKPVENLSMSVLGKKVHGPQGDDYGRVVDVFADGAGHVRVAIVEYGGFLGVGLRRIAVDWALLKFQPSNADSPWLLDVSREKLQGTPEFKDSGRPLALMAPVAAAPAAPPVTTPAQAPGSDPKK